MSAHKYLFGSQTRLLLCSMLSFMTLFLFFLTIITGLLFNLCTNKFVLFVKRNSILLLYTKKKSFCVHKETQFVCVRVLRRQGHHAVLDLVAFDRSQHDGNEEGERGDMPHDRNPKKALSKCTRVVCGTGNANNA